MGKAGPGVLVKTMRADLTGFKKYCKARQRLIPIFEYTELELLLMEYKYVQKYRLALFHHPLSHKHMSDFLKCLLKFGTYVDLMWALGLAITWGAALRTEEWAIKDGRSIHTPATLY